MCDTYDGVPVEVLDAAGRVSDSVILHCLLTAADDPHVAALGQDLQTMCEWIIAVQQAIVEEHERSAGETVEADAAPTVTFPRKRSAAAAELARLRRCIDVIQSKPFSARSEDRANLSDAANREGNGRVGANLDLVERPAS